MRAEPRSAVSRNDGSRLFRALRRPCDQEDVSAPLARKLLNNTDAMRRALLAGIVLVATLHQGCLSFDGGGGCDASRVSLGPDSGCWFFCFNFDACPNPFAAPAGAVHGARSDGRVDISAQQAWPNRPAPSSPPTPVEVATACAAFTACADTASTTDSTITDSVVRIMLQQACLGGSVELLDVNAAERVIPLGGHDESWDFFVRGVNAAKGDCSAIRALMGPRDSAITCQEDGCYATEARHATCAGDIATFKETGASRDCSRSGMQCSASSPTGCTDRALVQCTSGSKDRCDGDIKLGCDDCGFVSFHDCTWNGGHCRENPGGAACVPPGDASACVAGSQCNGTTLSLCVAGQPVEVDCKAIGLAGCISVDPSSSSLQSEPSCVDGSPLQGCTWAHCTNQPQMAEPACAHGSCPSSGGTGGAPADASLGAGGTRG